VISRRPPGRITLKSLKKGGGRGRVGGWGGEGANSVAQQACRRSCWRAGETGGATRCCTRKRAVLPTAGRAWPCRRCAAECHVRRRRQRKPPGSRACSSPTPRTTPAVPAVAGGMGGDRGGASVDSTPRGQASPAVRQASGRAVRGRGVGRSRARRRACLVAVACRGCPLESGEDHVDCGAQGGLGVWVGRKGGQRGSIQSCGQRVAGPERGAELPKAGRSGPYASICSSLPGLSVRWAPNGGRASNRPAPAALLGRAAVLRYACTAAVPHAPDRSMPYT
jgi:hypothetical protein